MTPLDWSIRVLFSFTIWESSADSCFSAESTFVVRALRWIVLILSVACSSDRMFACQTIPCEEAMQRGATDAQRSDRI
jgi:hypothetical protein